MIVLRIRGSRLAMSGSTRVPPKRPVLRPLDTDNSMHRQVVKQPRMLMGTANPGRITLLCVIPYLLMAEPRGGLLPSAYTRFTAERYRECALATKSKLVGHNFLAKLMCRPCWTNGGKDRTSWVHLRCKQFIYKVRDRKGM